MTAGSDELTEPTQRVALFSAVFPSDWLYNRAMLKVQATLSCTACVLYVAQKNVVAW